MAATINLGDIPPEQRKEMGLKKPRETTFGKEEVRSWGLTILALMASLTSAQRQRVLKHAERVNKV
jgi:hypothetical protein